MTREQIFAIWPRPWRLNENLHCKVVDAMGCEVLIVDAYDTRSSDAGIALAQMIVEWSNESDDELPDTEVAFA